jgi:hypothetical protein
MAKTEVEQIKLYGGEVVIDYYPNSHIYKINGETIPSVTGITSIIDKSGALLAWAERLTNEYVARITSDPLFKEKGAFDCINVESITKEAAHQYAVVKKEAAGIGDIVHFYAQQFATAKIEGKPLPRVEEGFPQQAINGINAFLEWVRIHEVKFIYSEFVVYSKKYKYVGQCDAFALVDGHHTYLEYKTSKSVYPEMQLQAAAYACAREEFFPHREVIKSQILHFNKDTGEFAVHPVNIKKAFQSFKAALKLKRTIKEIQ